MLSDLSEWFRRLVADLMVPGREQEYQRLVEELQRTLELSERRFEAVVGPLSDPITIRTRDNRLVYANRAALSHLGFESSDELSRTPPSEIMAGYDVFDEHGREISMDQIPSVRILRGEAAEPLLIRTVNHETGIQRWQLLKAAPLLDEAGDVEATIMVIEDVTERQRSERQAAFLARVGEVLASSLDYQQTLRNVAQLAVPEIVDWCGVDLVDEDGDREPMAVAHADPARLELAEQLREYEPVRPDPDRGLGRVFRTGEPVIYPEVTDEMLAGAAVDDRHLGLLRTVGFRSVAIVPMRLGTTTLGAMTLVNADSGRVIDRADLALAEQVAARAAVAIENSRLYSQRSRIAHTLQQSLLPEQLPEIPGYDLAGAYFPALAGSDVGGDFYDAWQVGDSWLITIGDVTGKGVEAAVLTSLVRHTMRTASEFVSSPAQLLARVDETLKKQRRLSICTALCLRLDSDAATLAVGGHPLPVSISTSGISLVGAHGPLLGGFAGARWHDTALAIERETTLLTYTDGVTDAIGEDGSRYGIQRLCRALDKCRSCSAAAVIDSVTGSLERYQSGPQADDTAVLALRSR
jgi:PAS domain S-box-containing protein